MPISNKVATKNDFRKIIAKNATRGEMSIPVAGRILLRGVKIGSVVL